MYRLSCLRNSGVERRYHRALGTVQKLLNPTHGDEVDLTLRVCRCPAVVAPTQDWSRVCRLAFFAGLSPTQDLWLDKLLFLYLSACFVILALGFWRRRNRRPPTMMSSDRPALR